MKSKEFLLNKLSEIYGNFSEIKIRYEYRSNTNSHIIEIIPLKFFKDNKKFMDLEAELEDEFELKYPNENLVFVSEESLTEIIHPDAQFGYGIIFSVPSEAYITHVKGYNQTNHSENINYALAA